MPTRWRIGIVAAAAAILALLYTFDPEATRWSPKCTLLLTTGWRCPGCGSQRFIHHLLHGELLAALRYNYLLASLTPWVATLFAAWMLPQTPFSRWTMTHLATRPIALTYLALYILWGVARNLLDL